MLFLFPLATFSSYFTEMGPGAHARGLFMKGAGGTKNFAHIREEMRMIDSRTNRS
jgi:hypothetical protein